MSALSPTQLFVCDGCQATLPYDAAQAGKKCRCGKCGKVLIVPPPLDVPPIQAQPAAKSQSVVPAYIEFWCRVCDTRLVAHGRDAGKKAKCPDCGASNAVPTPKVVEPRHDPAAMHGQQYGVWEVNKAPDPQKQRAAQPKLFSVYCRICDTLMYAQHNQVGGQLKCPDCGALTKVKEPPKEAEKKSPLVPDGQEYKLDASQQIAASVTPDYVERIKRESKIAAEAAAKKREEERPKIPRLPTINGVWSMLLKEPVPTWWVGTSALGMVVAGLVLEAVTTKGVGLAAMYVLCCTVAALLIGILWFGPTAAILCAIAAESSEGLKKLHSSPSPWIFESFMEMIYIFFSTALSLIPGFALIKFVPWQYSMAVGCGSYLVFFPVMLLSTFQEGSAMGTFSHKLWASVFQRPAHWLLFYFESAIIGAVAAAASIGLFYSGWVLAIVPVALAAAFVYFRVLGRFAWWLAESLSEDEPEVEPRYKRFN
jgi:DNA-directed RNA polymerase subunit M/transcription elongation factor TFIIS